LARARTEKEFINEQCGDGSKEIARARIRERVLKDECFAVIKGDESQIRERGY